MTPPASLPDGPPAPGRFPLPPSRLFDPDLPHEPAREWQADWNWTGLPAQLHCAEDRIRLWHTETLEPLETSFPDIVAGARDLLPGTLLEGHLLPWREERPLPHIPPHAAAPGARVFLATDCLAFQHIAIDTMPLYARLQQMFPIVGSADLPAFRCSEALPLAHWGDLPALLRHAPPAHVDGIRLRRRHDSRTDALHLLAR